MNVAGDRDQVFHVRVVERGQDRGPLGRVAVPLVEIGEDIEDAAGVHFRYFFPSFPGQLSRASAVANEVNVFRILNCISITSLAQNFQTEFVLLILPTNQSRCVGPSIVRAGLSASSQRVAK